MATPLLTALAARQLLLCIAAGWHSTHGQLQRFARADAAGAWSPVAESIPVVLGKSGLAWGRGLHPRGGDEPAGKREGDNRAPAGIFAISALFSDAGPDSVLARAAKLPYLQATDDLKAIDDPASAYYNRIVERSLVAQPDWASCEDMRRIDHRYAVGAVVNHNSAPPVPGAGSCIFLHVWEGEGLPTAGCTAMSLADMTALAGWLDAATLPLLVQLPLAEYFRWQAAWGLPVLPESLLSSARGRG